MHKEEGLTKLRIALVFFSCQWVRKWQGFIFPPAWLLFIFADEVSRGCLPQCSLMLCTLSTLRLNYTALPYYTVYRQVLGGHRYQLRRRLKKLSSLLGMDPQLYIRKIILNSACCPSPLMDYAFVGMKRWYLWPILCRKLEDRSVSRSSSCVTAQ